jgi:hypothetical protein
MYWLTYEGRAAQVTSGMSDMHEILQIIAIWLRVSATNAGTGRELRVQRMQRANGPQIWRQH